jgi:hypothetical protein
MAVVPSKIVVADTPGGLKNMGTVEVTTSAGLVELEVVVDGDPADPNALAAVVNSAPATAAYGKVVREASPLARPGGTAALTNVAQNASSVALLAANTARLSLKIFNDSTTDLYIAYGAAASLTQYVERIPPQTSWSMPRGEYTGVINGIWAAAGGGAARCTEVTP